MKKQVTVEIEVCDHCNEGKIPEDPNSKKRACDFCGKLLCWKCAFVVEGINVCPSCKDKKFVKYFEIHNEMDQLEKQYDQKEKEAKSIIEKLQNEIYWIKY